MLNDCKPSYAGDWSPLVSKTETLKFIAPVDCDSWLWWNPPQTFFATYKVTPVAGDRGSFNVFYWPDQKMKLDAFFIREHWWVTKPLNLGGDNKRQNPCAILYELPSADGRTPYYVPPRAQKQAEFNRLLIEVVVPAPIFFLLILVGSYLSS
jgi:hypothetical protein